MAILTVPKVLREKLGDDGVEALIALLNEAAHHERNNLLGILEERFERRVTEEGKRLEVQMAETEKRLDYRITEEVAKLDNRITEEIAKLDSRLTEEVACLDRRLTEEVARLETRLSTQMAATRADLIRWMFIFWVGQIGTLVALLFAFLR
ncbi:LA_3696 family protein [Rhodothermus marinus]|uniref:DUF1640 domain-containing protein n=1 Tax=Rhodothermus marinus (strain ATCC 43812 / DSM 4252 / R-10) TaxID=518766 RepID=D0MDK0_RHOM4|nr:hypothetical protein [Rhodothermus marinus]ACY47193.1 hypothetical protein Rmar_0287 [Rhodothermus marinus DSM 4252]